MPAPMLAKRVIPCLDVHDRQVTRGVRFGRAEAGGLRNYGLGQSFLWPGDVSTNVDTVNAAGMGGVPFVVLQFPDNNRDPRGANVLRIVGGLDQKILVPDAGELLINVVDKTNTVAYGNFLNN